MRPLDRSVLGHLLPARRSLACVVGAGIGTGLLTVAQAFALGALVVAAVSEPDGPAWHRPAAWLVLLVTLRVVTAYAGQLAAARAASVVSSTLRDRLLASARTRHDVGSRRGLTLLATRGVTSVEPYVTRYLPALVPAVVLPVATLAAIWWLDWLSGLIVLLTIPLVPVFAALVGMTTRDRADRQWRTMGALSGHFLDVVRGLPTLVAHRRALAQVETIRSVTDRYRRATVDTLKLAFASATVLELIATLSVALVAVCVGLRLAAGTVDFRDALTVLLLAPEAYWPLRRVGAEFHSAAEGAAALAEADGLLDGARPEDRDGARPAVREVRLETLEVGFGGTPLMAPLTLELPERGLLAVTGPSGCGKSTLLATLRGELPPVAGSVTVGGVLLDEVDADWWRSHVAWAPQRPWLLAGTVADNVRLGRPGASDEEVWAALDEVGLESVVRGLPGGLAAELGDDGAGLSAGQRARVSLARIVVARRPVVLLDEPSAHLDDETEEVILDTMARLARTSLVVVVAHRPAVVRAADREIALSPLPAPEAAPVATAAEVVVPPRALAPDDDVEDRLRWGMRTATVLGALSTASGVALTATAGWLITRASEQPPVLYLMVAIVGVRLFGLARPVLRHAERVISHDVVLRELAERRTRVFADLVPLVPGRLGPRRGDLLTQVVDDVDAVLDDRLRVRQPLVTSVLVGLGAVALAASLDAGAGVVVLLVVLTGPLAFVQVRRRGARSEPELLDRRAALGTRVEDVVAGLRELEQWQAADRELEVVRAESDGLARAALRSASAVAAGHALTGLAAGLGVVGIAAAVTPGSTSPATLSLLLLLPLALDDVLSPLGDAGALSVRSRAARDRLARLARLTPAVADPAAPSPRPASYDVVLDAVTVGWDERPALQAQDLRVRPGEHVGIVGPSGSGKSTLAATLMRFLDPSAGAYVLGGTDARDLLLDDTRTIVGLVDDDPYVFASSVVENVRLARPAATDAEVARALAGAGLARWVGSLPRGLHTHVGAGSREVSGGERARIGLARSLLAESTVLVLDEPTAHLDASTARHVTGDLLAAAAGAGRSIVWITHGTIGLDEMDRVVRLSAPGATSSTTAERVPTPA
ncbi:thiol reductant ABC exporter subunit CydD [Nocardioides seonyuensis]|uniref:Thiol reductant ABC exporter subunit CydD n=1 Tax=Nocardioides seonyuensis TaxID=2518371 RepID=A0A4P7IFL3_9ACTN|nr:thiol reductant ABC exporter subunit CydD [Nocardioides seonyuensis]QBX54491.1 thiol reductant ABC exporter subunit CydD [Nocardioides seonyuensis]